MLTFLVGGRNRNDLDELFQNEFYSCLFELHFPSIIINSSWYVLRYYIDKQSSTVLIT